MRKQHEDATWRSRYMQKFDMQAWLDTHRGQQATPIKNLVNTVAEYSAAANACEMKLSTPFELKKIEPGVAEATVEVCETLSPGNGAILVLADPVAAAMEISALSRHRITHAFEKNNDFQRGMAMDAMLTGLEVSLKARFNIDFDEQFIHMEEGLRSGKFIQQAAVGFAIPAIAFPELAEQTKRNSEDMLSDKVQQEWQKYEKYIDRTQQQEFRERLNKQLTAYNQRIIVPMTRTYLGWLQSEVMQNYFVQHFDSSSVLSGIRYMQTVFDCLNGMQDKLGVINFVREKLKLEPEKENTKDDKNNYLLRAVYFNNDEWVKKSTEELNKPHQDWVASIGWDRLGDVVKTISGVHLAAVRVGLEKLNVLFFTFVEETTDAMMKNQMVRSGIVMLVAQGKRFERVEVNMRLQPYVKALTKAAGGYIDMSTKSGSRLYNALYKSMAPVFREIPEGASIKTYLPVLIDLDEAAKIKAMPDHQKLRYVKKILLTEQDVLDHVFPRNFRSQLTVAENKAVGSTLIADISHNSFKFAGTSFSAAFQSWALFNGLSKDGWPGSANGLARLGANAAMALGALMDGLNMVAKGVVALRAGVLVTASAGLIMKVSGYTIWSGISFLGGILYAGLEIAQGMSNMLDEIKENNDIGIAHLVNGLGVGVLAVATSKTLIVRFLTLVSLSAAGIIEGQFIFTMLFGPVGILVGALLVIASGLYLVSQSRNSIQDFLIQTLWRKVPLDEGDVPLIFPNSLKERESFTKLSKDSA